VGVDLFKVHLLAACMGVVVRGGIYWWVWTCSNPPGARCGPVQTHLVPGPVWPAVRPPLCKLGFKHGGKVLRDHRLDVRYDL